MATLRNIIDGKTLEFASVPAKLPTNDPEQQDDDEQEQEGTEQQGFDPHGMAQHISETLSDPLEKTKKGFEDLTQAKLNYDSQRERARREGLPALSVLQHLDNIHQLGMMPTMGTSPMDPNSMNNDPNLGYQEENQGVPPNMSQTPGMMQQSRPGQQVSAPGVGPKIPTPPMGVPGADQQQKPTAAKPPGAGSMAKKPGSPAKKKSPSAGGNGAGSKVSVHVHAQQVGNGYAIQSGARTLSHIFGAEQLRQQSACKDDKMAARGTSEGVRKAWESRRHAVGDRVKSNVNVPGLGRQSGTVLREYTKGANMGGKEQWIRVRHDDGSETSSPGSNYDRIQS